MEDKISRICWNTEGWKFPSGSRGKSSASTSFEAKHGYGHEEWLFDRSRIVDDYHYAFLQPLGLKSDKHVDKIYNIFLFTVTNGIKYFAGMIKNAHSISKDESKKIHKIYKQRGWLKEMENDVERAGADPQSFRDASTDYFFNIRFKFENVIRPAELEQIADSDINITTTRYKLLPKRSNIKIATETEEIDIEGKLKNIQRRNRIYKVESSFDPYHDKMQNAICGLLRNTYKNEYKKVFIERDRIDIKGKTHEDRWHFFEIKTDAPKLSVRNALGQLIEYSYWPDSERAEKLIIVSDNEPDLETEKYLAHIREKFKIPIFYRFFDITKNTLSKDY
jgi:hypothetical protein